MLDKSWENLQSDLLQLPSKKKLHGLRLLESERKCQDATKRIIHNNDEPSQCLAHVFVELGSF